ncbi:hypothetical protein [Actinoplanes sp. NPDC049265]|uniref:hypothetical protein n=1 Tax=Actinoplanes sp. NPDC049265 TaxID=3363902 RepID=UPI0037126B9D
MRAGIAVTAAGYAGERSAQRGGGTTAALPGGPAATPVFQGGPAATRVFQGGPAVLQLAPVGRAGQTA